MSNFDYGFESASIPSPLTATILQSTDKTHLGQTGMYLAVCICILWHVLKEDENILPQFFDVKIFNSDFFNLQYVTIACFGEMLPAMLSVWL